MLKQITKKLKIYNISDLHIECYSNYNEIYDKIKYKIPNADILILAGDIGYPINRKNEISIDYINLLNEFKKKYENILLVPGNHEYYQINEEKGITYEIINKLIKDICNKTEVKLLNNNTYIINRTKYIGTTLWSEVDKTINLNRINKNNEEFYKCYKWLKQELEKEHDKGSYDNKVIITHHLPTYKLCDKIYENSKHKSLFYTEIIDKLNTDKVKYWFAGHTHENNILNYDNMKIIINPYGYPNEKRYTNISYKTYDI